MLLQEERPRLPKIHTSAAQGLWTLAGVVALSSVFVTIAYVVLRSGQSADANMESDLKAFVKTRLTPHKYPREIVFIKDLPKTATGKIQRFKLRESDSH